MKIEAITPVAGNVPLELTLRTLCLVKSPAVPTFQSPQAPGHLWYAAWWTATYAHGENGLGGAVFPNHHKARSPNCGRIHSPESFANIRTKLR